ncbi:MAG: S-adenosylmethionine:tRNA ribosyltransferase-isomerase [Flavobacteriales bacterium]|jgi:S-adenosylmethionine:tRNA ribosyltransferase-isomerase|nr:S-adenosylmethionine:tRNA ribosyltransferase-isomerase [Flavobacteriales bacterium]
MGGERTRADRQAQHTDPRSIAITDLTYALPEDRIAQHPLAERDAAKLLVHREGEITDRRFTNLPEELPGNTLLVLNDTRVVHARIAFRRSTGALIECMVLSPALDRPMEEALNRTSPVRWWCMMGNAKRWKGEELLSEKEGHSLKAERKDLRDGEHLIEFSWEGEGAFIDQLDHFGDVPLPPYMRRAVEPSDDRRYNTVFGIHPGSVAAPTASLHFTPEMMEAIAQKGIATSRVTLHVGAGTFLPVKSTTMRDHAMHSEQVRVPRSTVETLLGQIGKGPIVPVGTTAMRTIESLYWFGAEVANGNDPAQLDVEQWRPYADAPLVNAGKALKSVLAWLDRHDLDTVAGSTRLLIAPGYEFRLADGLITNFHQPRSTLLLLVAALIGTEWRNIYAHALAHGYRFLSYGDGSLLWRKT